MWINLNVDVDDIISELGYKERKELFDELKSEFDDKTVKGRMVAENVILTMEFENLSAWEMKKLLCNALGVGSYYDEQTLRKALEPIITAP